jgi:hypothetical protein
MKRKRVAPNLFRKRLYGDWCIYCGDWATTEDHFPPHCVTNLGMLFPACLECNLIAGSNYASDFDERCNYVKDGLRRKYARVLGTPDWHKDEIGELGRTLKTSVLRHGALKASLKPRLAWNYKTYLACIDPDNLFGDFLDRWAKKIEARKRAAEKPRE